jgi:hypothetical protein
MTVSMLVCAALANHSLSFCSSIYKEMRWLGTESICDFCGADLSSGIGRTSADIQIGTFQ